MRCTAVLSGSQGCRMWTCLPQNTIQALQGVIVGLHQALGQQLYTTVGMPLHLTVESASACLQQICFPLM